MEKQKIYIETSIISYLTARPSSNLIIAGHQKITYDWWYKAKKHFDCYISVFVVNEIKRGDINASKKRLQVIENIEMLELLPEVELLAEYYFNNLFIPQKAKLDAYHLAVACIHNIDFLLSWNCKHIANSNINRLIQNLNNKIGMKTPFFCTPEQLMEY